MMEATHKILTCNGRAFVKRVPDRWKDKREIRRIVFEVVETETMRLNVGDVVFMRDGTLYTPSPHTGQSSTYWKHWRLRAL